MPIRNALARSLLAAPTLLPLRAASDVAAFGATLVVAPHPDDESLGCGGVIALLRQMGYAVSVLVMSDGTRSHPRSRRFPPPVLRALRETEALMALDILGVAAEQVAFLRLPDCAVPGLGTAGFEATVARCHAHLAAVAPATILLPWRRDPHCDHRATWEIIWEVVASLASRPRLLEYPIWTWELSAGDDAPRASEARVWRFDISPVVEQKQAAIAAHRSQTTDLISDDPDGFRLSPDVLMRFAQPWELYLEAWHA